MPPRSNRRPAVIGLGLLFGTMYFVQGIGEPTDGLVAQPVRSLLRDRGFPAGTIATFSALLALPWSLKPLFGLLTDFVPLFGTRRRSYLLVSTAAAAAGRLLLAALPVRELSALALGCALLLPAIGFAFGDVVIDAVMIERGQPLGLTGRFQSIQWASGYAALILAGWLGGRLSGSGRQGLGFLICGLAAAASCAVTWRFVREAPDADRPQGLRKAVAALWTTARSPVVLAVGSFLFLWSFNPFAVEVLQFHMRKAMGFEDEFIGTTTSYFAVAAVAASIAYGFYCRRLTVGTLVHLSIALGVASTLGYWAMSGRGSAVAVTLCVGFAYMTATLIQLDLAAQACPPEVAGTAFALLMAVSNLAVSLSTALGGQLYGPFADRWGAAAAFRLLVAIGAAFTAASWLLVPLLKRHARGWYDRLEGDPPPESESSAESGNDRG